MTGATADMAIYFGTMTFGWSQSSSAVDEAVATEMVKSFAAGGGTRLDTARIYAGGKTEPIVGATLAAVAGMRVASEICPILFADYTAEISAILRLSPSPKPCLPSTV